MRTQTTHCPPRSYKFTPDGSKLLIGFTNGDLQVGMICHVTCYSYYCMYMHKLQLIATETAEEVWMVQNAHSSEIVRCHFSFDGTRVVTISSESHKVGVADVSNIIYVIT